MQSPFGPVSTGRRKEEQMDRKTSLLQAQNKVRDNGTNEGRGDGAFVSHPISSPHSLILLTTLIASSHTLYKPKRAVNTLQELLSPGHKILNQVIKKIKRMEQVLKLTALTTIVLFSVFSSCSPGTGADQTTKTDSVEANIKMYTHTWDEIINRGKLDMFNDSNFKRDVVMHANPDVIGIDSARAMYANYVNGFSNIKFTIVDVFGQGDKLVKHWNFKGKHTGPFFGIPATGKDVNVEGVTLVKMRGGKIAEEQDFFDNLAFMQQLGLMPPGK